MTKMISNRVDVNRLLVEMRAMKSQTQAFQRPAEISPQDSVKSSIRPGFQVETDNKIPSFGDMMSQAVNKVNDVQKQSAAMATAYERGDKNIDITDVMVASQKATVSFQSMVQVRNKLVDAYRDVMNMPI
jgi:flagellar hook-basal body complex protein FliE